VPTGVDTKKGKAGSAPVTESDQTSGLGGDRIAESAWLRSGVVPGV